MHTPVILCIGTDSVSGDCLGPIVGDLLTERYNVRAFVYGKTARTVNGANFGLYERMLSKLHPKSLVIAVDACVGSKADVGKIKVSDGVRAGGALRKSYGKVGNIGILGVVCEKQPDNLFALMQVDFNLVQAMGERIAGTISSLLASLKLG